ncbi:MAG: 30S ribosomal protein S20 [Erysipelotrichaceae bacterium]
MPQIKSQFKRVKTNNKKRLANAAKKSDLRTSIKTVNIAIENKDKEAAVVAFNVVNKKLDKLVNANIFHKKNAARQKSKLAQAINSLDK